MRRRSILDVVTLGETMIRFSPPFGESLEGASVFHVDPGGAESNVAVALARLGLQVGWISRLPDNALGRRIGGQIRHHGVDISRVIWATGERVGTYYIEPGRSPRPTNVIYDRRHSALSRLTPKEVDWDYIRQGDWLHLTGITPALGDGPKQVVERAIREATGAGAIVSFDVNYRPKLWTASEAAAVLTPLLEQVTILQCARRDAALLFGAPEAGDETACELFKRYRPRVVVVTSRGAGAYAYDGAAYHVPSVSVDTVDPIGSGDAFAAGFIAGYRQGDVDTGLMWGSALATLKRTYRGDILWSGRIELDAILNRVDVKIHR